MVTKYNCLITAECNKKIQLKQTFVLNIVASWCSDCTAQQENIPYFKNKLIEKNIDVFELIAQHHKDDFVDHSTMLLVEKMGGHGYPRTILFVNGEAVSCDNIEVINRAQLCELATQFLDRV